MAGAGSTKESAGSAQAHQYVIIGAGPAGLQLSYFLQRAGADYVTLEREDAPAQFFRRYPRHRRLISLSDFGWTTTMLRGRPGQSLTSED